MLLIGSACRQYPNPSSQISASPDSASSTTSQVQTRAKRILFFGNSLTAGLGLPDANQAFPGLVQQRLDSLDLAYTVINAGVSGETTAGGKERISWILKDTIDIFVLELGANDGLRGIPPTATLANLQAIIDEVKTTYPACKIVLAGMMMPPSMGQDYTTAFKEVFPTLAKKNDLVLIPFLLEGVAGDPQFNLQDGIHPNVAGHRQLFENVWTYLAPIL
jgi:acyl-CoA thioesterase-1